MEETWTAGRYRAGAGALLAVSYSALSGSAQLGITERPSGKAEIADRDDLVRETEDCEHGLYAMLVRSDPDRADHEEQDPDESHGCDKRNVKKYVSASPEQEYHEAASGEEHRAVGEKVALASGQAVPGRAPVHEHDG